jgi:molybdopterin-guanine dinucleotide biosynthesis adapter protein
MIRPNGFCRAQNPPRLKTNAKEGLAMRVIGLVGWSGAGKTSLIVKLIPRLNARGFAVSTLKHAHHSFDVDQPGKDSYSHRAAGACEVLVASASRWALMHELGGADEPALAALLARMSPVDFVIVEGFKRDAYVKVEVHRLANGKPLLFPDDPSIKALISDVVAGEATLPFAHLDDVEGAATLIERFAEPIGETMTRLGQR